MFTKAAFAPRRYLRFFESGSGIIIIITHVDTLRDVSVSVGDVSYVTCVEDVVSVSVGDVS